MRVTRLADLADLFGGEYVLGKEDLGTEGLYLVFGRLGPGEHDRLVLPGEGFEEIFCCVDGSLVFQTRTREVVLEPGHAVSLRNLESGLVSNPTGRTVTYIIAGSPGIRHCS
ncbi:MAG: hypothetical protein AB1646_01565 [Thermodesulfobacteriota bacterium]